VAFEYEEIEAHLLIVSNGLEVACPSFLGHNYDQNCHITAIRAVDNKEEFVSFILAHSSVMTICSSSKVLFLAADKYHPDCFSIEEELYDTELDNLRRLGLVN
jgi:hypothetical protein